MYRVLDSTCCSLINLSLASNDNSGKIDRYEAQRRDMGPAEPRDLATGGVGVLTERFVALALRSTTIL